MDGEDDCEGGLRARGKPGQSESSSDGDPPVLMDLGSPFTSGLVSPASGLVSPGELSKEPSLRIRRAAGEAGVLNGVGVDAGDGIGKLLRSSPLEAGPTKPRRKTVALNSCIIPLIVVVLVSAVVIVTVVSYLWSQAATTRLSTYFLDQISQRVSERFKELQQAAERTAMSIVIWIVGGPLPDSAGAPNSYLTNALGLFASASGVPSQFSSAHFPVISQLYLQSLSVRGYEPFEYLGFGLPNRENLLVKREKASFGTTYPDAAVPYFSIVEYKLNNTIQGQVDRYTSYVTKSGARRTYSVIYNDLYDVRQRAFYTLAEQARRQAWTPVITFVFGLSGFLCATPVYTPGDDRLKAVVTIGFQSDSLSNYLQQIEVAQNGFAALIADDSAGNRRAIAFKNWQLSLRATVLNPTQGTVYEFVPTAELKVPEIREMLLAMPGDVHALEEDARLRSLSFTVDGLQFDGRLLRIMGTRDNTKELSLAMVVAAPARDVQGEVRLLTVVNAVVCSVASALAIAVGAFVLLEISRNMRQLKSELGRLSFFDSQLSPLPGEPEGLVESLGPESPPPRRRLPRWLQRGGPKAGGKKRQEQFGSVLKELDQVGEAFTRMKHALAVVATIGDAVVVLDEAGAVVQMNSSARRMFGVGGEAGRFAQRPVSELFRLGPESGGPLFQRLLRGEGAGPVSGCTIECTALAPEREFPVELSIGRAAYGGNVIEVLVVRDASQRKAMEAAIQASEAAARVLAEDLRRIITSANAPIFSVDEELRVTGWNRAAERVTERPEGEMLGQPFVSVVAPDEAESAARALEEALSGKEVAAYECTLVGKGGAKTVRLLLSATAQRDSAGGTVGVVAVGHDITEKRRMIEIETANETKNRFLAYTVHELRTPLNGILGMNDLLRETELSPEQADLTHSIHQCGEQLLAIVNDLLDLHKIEAGKVVLESIPFDLRDCAEEVLEVVAPTALAKGIEIACRVPLRMPTALRGDPHRLKQIITNFAFNGVKFTQKGSVVVYVTAVRAAAGRLTFRVDVQDTGIGIDEEGLACIFADYVQADSSITRLYGGTGMGLAVSKKLVKLMGGRIGVASEIGKGSRFFFQMTLPLDAAAYPDGFPAFGPPPPPASTRRGRPLGTLVESPVPGLGPEPEADAGSGGELEEEPGPFLARSRRGSLSEPHSRNSRRPSIASSSEEGHEAVPTLTVTRSAGPRPLLSPAALDDGAGAGAALALAPSPAPSAPSSGVLAPPPPSSLISSEAPPFGVPPLSEPLPFPPPSVIPAPGARLPAAVERAGRRASAGERPPAVLVAHPDANIANILAEYVLSIGGRQHAEVRSLQDAAAVAHAIWKLADGERLVLLLDHSLAHAVARSWRPRVTASVFVAILVSPRRKANRELLAVQSRGKRGAFQDATLPKPVRLHRLAATLATAEELLEARGRRRVPAASAERAPGEGKASEGFADDDESDSGSRAITASPVPTRPPRPRRRSHVFAKSRRSGSRSRDRECSPTAAGRRTLGSGAPSPAPTITRALVAGVAAAVAAELEAAGLARTGSALLAAQARSLSMNDVAAMAREYGSDGDGGSRAASSPRGRLGEASGEASPARPASPAALLPPGLAGLAEATVGLAGLAHFSVPAARPAQPPPPPPAAHMPLEHPRVALLRGNVSPPPPSPGESPGARRPLAGHGEVEELRPPSATDAAGASPRAAFRRGPDGPLSLSVGNSPRSTAARSGPSTPTGRRAATEGAVPAEGAFQPLILVADDVDLNQKVCRALLAKAGFARVEVVAHGQAAVEFCQQHGADLVLMDVEMPVKDGLAATREIRALEAAGAIPSRIPIVALTANSMEGSRERCVAAGMDEAIFKPVRKDDLIAAVERHTPWRRPPK